MCTDLNRNYNRDNSYFPYFVDMSGVNALCGIPADNCSSNNEANCSCNHARQYSVLVVPENTCTIPDNDCDTGCGCGNSECGCSNDNWAGNHWCCGCGCCCSHCGGAGRCRLVSDGRCGCGGCGNIGGTNGSCGW